MNRITAPTGRNRRTSLHDNAKSARNARFALGVYGVVRKPFLQSGAVVVHEPPGYLASRRTARSAADWLRDGVDRKLDFRCFYSSIPCKPTPSLLGLVRDPVRAPFLPTRDHLVPMRRNIPGSPLNPGIHPSTLVWTANIVNTTLGLAPLLVRLKIRQWLMTSPFDREDVSAGSGANVRWVIIDMLDSFRVHRRYPWSRAPDGTWWNPAVSEPFMRRMWAAELRFLTLGEDGREKFIKDLRWQF